MAKLLPYPDGVERFSLRGLMKTLTSDKTEILARLAKLRPDSQRQWGKMTPNQMICHLTDSFVSMMGDKAVSSKSNLFMRTAGKWIALKAPMKWPPNITTMPENDQEIGGTKPVEFDADRQKLLQAIERFTAAQRDFSFHSHPIFGAMSETEWMIWGYKHCDHHLRQFGV
ncbi:MAG TPA: DUF1569 domain-containing protein [Blastocatellia bacterium]|nr:DUF1569 domain-containing protein [Blastocatellia bacterium]